MSFSGAASTSFAGPPPGERADGGRALGLVRRDQHHILQRREQPGHRQRGRLCRDQRSDVWHACAVGETAILLHPPLPSVGVSTWMERGCVSRMTVVSARHAALQLHGLRVPQLQQHRYGRRGHRPADRPHNPGQPQVCRLPRRCVVPRNSKSAQRLLHKHTWAGILNLSSG